MTKHGVWRFGIEWLTATLIGLALSNILFSIILFYPRSFFDYYETEWITRPIIALVGATWGELAKNTAVHISTALSNLRDLVMRAAIEGGSIGITQWYILRRYKYRVDAWALVSAFGWIAGWVISQKASWPIASILIDGKGKYWEYHIFLGYTLFGLFFGALIGTSQWFVLRQHIRHASLWVIVNIVTWASAVFVSETIVDKVFWAIVGYPFSFHDERFTLNNTVIQGFIMTLVGGCTGIALFRLLQQTSHTNPQGNVSATQAGGV